MMDMFWCEACRRVDRIRSIRITLLPGSMVLIKRLKLACIGISCKLHIIENILGVAGDIHHEIKRT